MYNFKINEELCIKCGLCAKDCVTTAITMDGYPVLNEEKCFKCQHCLAVCPTGALSIFDKNPEDLTKIDCNLPTADAMKTMIKGRRSIRSYKDESIAPEVLKELLETSWHAPTGGNSQQVHLAATQDKDATERFRKEFYNELNKAFKAGIKTKNEGMQNTLEFAVNLYNEKGIDILLRNAPHILFVTSPIEGVCPVEDPIIYLSYFEMMAQSMNIGTLWDGLAYGSLSLLPQEFTARFVPEGHKLAYVMCFGLPAVKYARTIQRDNIDLNMLDWK